MGGTLGGLGSSIPSGLLSTSPLASLGGGANGVFNSIPNSSVARSLGSVFGPLVGASGGVNGTGRPAPTAVNLQSPVSGAQISGSYGGAQNALGSQQALLAALQGQQSFAAQSGALAQQQALAGQLAGANGVGNLSGALASQQALAAQQQGLASQYANIAAGQGPNPALAALNQATGQNVANQSALMAGQRGAGSNVGLIARQAAQQGAATQQQAVGQAATTQAQQSLGALSGEQAQQQAIGQTQQNIANIAGQQIGQQQAQQQAIAAQANAMAGQQIGATTANTQAQQSEQQLLQNALAQYNQQQVGMQSNINSANAGLAQTSLQGQQALFGGLLNAGGAGLAALAGAEGGKVEKKTTKKFADGGDAWTSGQYINPPETQNSITAPPTTLVPQVQAPIVPSVQIPDPTGPQSSFGKFLKGATSPASQKVQNGQTFNMTSGSNSGAQALQQGVSGFGPAIANALKSKTPTTSEDVGMGSESGTINAVNSVPDAISNPIAADAFAAKGGLAKKGGKVDAKKPSQKAVKKGNSYDNDKIPAYLSEGEVVIPRSVMQSEDPVRAAGEFVAKIMAQHRGKR